MHYLAASVVSFMFIFLKATQQRQVMAAQIWRMPPISLAMGYCEVFLVGTTAYSVGGGFWPLFWLATCIGIGGAGGSMLGTYLHKRRHG